MQYDFEKTIKEGRFCPTGTVHKPDYSVLFIAFNPLMIFKATKYLTISTRQPETPAQNLKTSLLSAQSSTICLNPNRNMSSWSSHVPSTIESRPARIYRNIVSNNQIIEHGRTDRTDSFNRSDIVQSFLQAHRMHDFGLGIVRKSDGVFLWVRLMVKAIIRGTLRQGPTFRSPRASR